MTPKLAQGTLGRWLYPLLLNTILFNVFSNPVSWTTRNLMTLDPVSSLLLLPKLHLPGPWSVDQFMRGLSTQILHSLVCLNLNQRMVTYQRRMWCTPTYRVYKLWLINNKKWQEVLKSLHPSFNSDRNSKRIGTEIFFFLSLDSVLIYVTKWAYCFCFVLFYCNITFLFAWF